MSEGENDVTLELVLPYVALLRVKRERFVDAFPLVLDAGILSLQPVVVLTDGTHGQLAWGKDTPGKVLRRYSGGWWDPSNLGRR